MTSSAHRNDERERWAGAFIRGSRLRIAEEEWKDREAAYRREYPFGPGPGSGMPMDEALAWMKKHTDATERLTHAGEAVLMFADAATNALVAAIFGSWGVTGDQPSVRIIAKGLERDSYSSRSPDISRYADRFWSVFFGVNLPRHQLAVHPPVGRTANRFNFGPVTYMGWMGPWDPTDTAWLRLQQCIQRDTSIPDKDAEIPDRLIAWVIDHPEGLSLEGRNRIIDFTEQHGILVAPRHAAARVRGLLRDIAKEFGFRREDFFSEW